MHHIQTRNKGLTHLFAALFLAAVLAFASPASASAATVSEGVNSTITFTMQENTASASTNSASSTSENAKVAALASTGDEFALLILAISAVLAGSAYVFAQKKRLAGEHVSYESTQLARKKLLCVAVATALVASGACAGFFAKNTALAETVGSKIACTANVTVDSSGAVQNATVNVENASDKAVEIASTIMPAGIEGMGAKFEENTVQASASAEGTLTGATVSQDVLEELKENGKAERSFTATFSYDNTVQTNSEGMAATFDPAATPAGETNFLVTSATGEPLEQVTVEVDASGKVIVTLPSLLDGEDVLVTLTDATGNVLAGRSVVLKSSAGEVQGEGETKSNGTIGFGDVFSFIQNFTVNAENATYTGKQITPSVSGLEQLEKDVDYTLTWGENVSAGTYAGSVTIKGIGTYSGELTEIFTIAPKTVAVTGVSVQERAYSEGDTTATVAGTPSISASEICEGDDVQVASVAGTFADENAGDAKDVSLTFTLGGADASNYAVSDASKTIKGNILAVVNFTSNCAATIPSKNVHIGASFADDVTAQLPDREGYEVEGWYNNSACAENEAKGQFKWDFSTNAASQNVTTLFANWAPDETTKGEYWLAPAQKITTGNTATTANVANDNYTSPLNNVVKTSAEIRADVAKIKAGDAATIAEYEGYMQTDAYHLYTTYADANAKGAEDGFAEFRIVEVGNHDADEALTFQATHVLPTAARQKSSRAASAWGRTELCSRMNSGDIFTSFKTAFTDDILEVEKASAEAGNSTITPATHKLWLASMGEVSGGYRTNEGTQYAFFKNVGVTYGEENPALVLKTREGNVCEGDYWVEGRWWTRSTTYTNSVGFMAITDLGVVDAWPYYYPYRATGISPCFSF